MILLVSKDETFHHHTTLTFQYTIFIPLGSEGRDRDEGRQGDKLSVTYETIIY